MMYAQQATMSSSILTNIGWLVSPGVTSYAGSALAETAILTDVGNVVQGMLNVCLLWFPGFWTGALVWVYLLICLPISISMIFAVVSVIRGVHSS